MKSTGIVRKVDNLGRVVLPKELRITLDINYLDSLEIFTEGSNIILKKYTPGCHCCKSMDELTEVLGLKLCEICIKQFNEARAMIEELR